MHKPVLIGMNNPLWRGAAGYELYPAPEGCTGHRLWRMLNERTGAFRRDYLDTFDRRNLVTGNVGYDYDIAKSTADNIFREFWGSGRVVVLLGEDVRRAFGHPRLLLHPQVIGGCTWRQVPHPSGRNLWYNSQENRNLVAVLLEELYNDYCSARSQRELTVQ